MKKLSLVLMLVIFALGTALAQRTITGTINDDTGEPLIGANVLVKGTTVGTVTDFDGKYTLEVPDNAKTLVISYTGYSTQELALGASNIADVTLSEGVSLNEVVVTALGVSREKKSLGFATQEVAGSETTKVKDANFINSLSGKVAGVDIKRSAQIGGSSNVIIRGYTSLGNNNQALFVVDGIPIDNSIGSTQNQRTGRGGYDFGNAAMDINPEDIESVNILKGAAATALYGSRGANGVVLITTKRGSKGKALGVTVSTGLTLGTIDRTTMPEYQKEYGPGYSTIQGWYAQEGFDFYDFGDGPGLATAAYEDASYGPRYDGQQVYDWRSYYAELGTLGQTFPYVAAETDGRDFYETSSIWNTNVSIDGGTESTSYRLSFTNFNQEGIVPNSKIERNSVSFAGGMELTEKLSVTSTINYILTEGRGRYGTGYDNRNPNQSFRQWYSTNVDMNDQREAYLSTGKNISWNPYGPLDPNRATVPHYFDNYYFNAYENIPTDERSRIFGNIVLDYKLTDWLSAKARFSTDRYSSVEEERIAVGSVDVSKYERRDISFFENNVDFFLNANKYFGEGDIFNIDAMIGTNYMRQEYSLTRASTNGGLVVPGLYSLSNSSGPLIPSEDNSTLAYETLNELGVIGYFGRVTLGYNRLLYLDLTGRYDIASSLPQDENAYFYPSASLSFVFSELIESSVLSFGKFRINYAEVGNYAPARSVDDTYVLGTPFDGNALASAPGTKNNSELKPERTESFEVGVEMMFLNNRIGLDASFYKANSFDQILAVDVTGATGRLAQFVNAGEIENKGFEVALNINPVRIKDFRWDVSVNWARNRNEVISLFQDQTNLQLATAQGGISINATVGQPYGTIWGTDYVRHTDGSPIVYPHWNGGVRYRKTATPDNVIGDINPDWKGGINNRFSYKNLAFSFLIDIQKGGDFFSLDMWYGTATGIYDFTAGTNREGGEVRALPADGGGIFIDGAVMQTDTDADGNPISDGTPNTEAFYASDVYNSLGYVYAPNAYHIYDASFVKLRELNLTYSLPNSLLGNLPFAGVDFSLVGRNLWIIHKNSPYTDPEAGLSAGNIQGNQSGAYPAVKEYGFNIRVQF